MDKKAKIREMYAEDQSYLVCIRYEDPFECIAQKCVGFMDYRSAKTFLKHFNKLNYDLWSDREQTGIYCMIVSRNYCTNHKDYENDYNLEWLDYRV